MDLVVDEFHKLSVKDKNMPVLQLVQKLDGKVSPCNTVGIQRKA